MEHGIRVSSFLASEGLGGKQLSLGVAFPLTKKVSMHMIDLPSDIQTYQICMSLEWPMSLPWIKHVFPTDQPE